MFYKFVYNFDSKTTFNINNKPPKKTLEQIEQHNS